MEEFLETTFEKFIFKVKIGCFYSREDFWANVQDHMATVGLTDFLQKSKGDVAFLETVEPGTTVNPEMEASPYLINNDPYGAGWIYRIKLAEPETDKGELLEATDYFELMKQNIAKEAKKLYGKES